MSTGQRTALVLLVFFQLHLSNHFAPAFLLIDGSVANIDELNNTFAVISPQIPLFRERLSAIGFFQKRTG
jgi:hypothetical protein